MSNFDFPRIKISDVKEVNDLSNEQLVAKMIDMAKVTITSQTAAEKLIGGRLDVEDLLEKKPDADKQTDVVNSPSMLVLCCNVMEVIRLKEELVQRIHETDLLSIIYKQQLKLVNKDSFKLVLNDPINFETQALLKDNMNMVDVNDGSKVDFDLAFREFDYTLRACLDFKSDSCVKALMTDMGLEELRAVLHY